MEQQAEAWLAGSRGLDMVLGAEVRWQETMVQRQPVSRRQRWAWLQLAASQQAGVQCVKCLRHAAYHRCSAFQCQ
jgi:hypothetical protein